MSFRDLDIKSSYDSDSSDVLNELYIPVLSEARTYYRLSGFFSSSSLAVAARGVSKLIKNSGKMKLIVGATLSEKDVEAIRGGTSRPEDFLSDNMSKDLESIEDEITRNHVHALGWMVANDVLEIKVAMVVDESGTPMATERARFTGIFHQKVGIMEDSDGNVISFSGSVNETANAWKNNIEELKVFRGWVEGEVDHLKADTEKFERYWTGGSSKIILMEVPEAVKRKLIKMAPASFDSIDMDDKEKKIRVELRDYQISALGKWKENGMKGMFEMATGTGKTYAALGCLRSVMKDNERIVTVIACPTLHLVTQWSEEVEKFGLGKTVRVPGKMRKWKDEVLDLILDVNNGHRDNLIFVTTHNTFSSPAFVSAMESCKAPLMLIADEVHGIGSEKNMEGLSKKYAFRVGLSATPRRWMDDYGTDIIYKFFGDVVFEFTLKEAIRKGMLTPYEYKPEFVQLKDSEMVEYERQSREISRKYHMTRDSDERRELFNLLLIKRKNIIKNAENKMEKLPEILDKLESAGGIGHCLIYCSPRQISKVQNILKERGIVASKFIEDKSVEDRKTIIDGFAEGKWKVLVAIKCLDEGVDIPPTRYAILMSSSGNPREYIQRRGRLLRKSEGKRKAVIYDMIAVPNGISADEDVAEMERKIIAREYSRYKEFAEDSINSPYCTRIFIELKDKFGLSWEDLDEGQ